MIRYVITDRSLWDEVGNDGPTRSSSLIAACARWAEQGMDYIQLREKDLEPAEQAALACKILQAIAGTPTRLLINHRADIALATGAHGVHLTAHPDELTPAQIRSLYAERPMGNVAAENLPAPIISISCHTIEEVTRAAESKVDLVLFGPVFEKRIPRAGLLPGLGLDALKAAIQAARGTPVLALGGVTWAQVPACNQAGAAGIAAIRLFA